MISTSVEANADILPNLIWKTFHHFFHRAPESFNIISKHIEL